MEKLPSEILEPQNKRFSRNALVLPNALNLFSARLPSQFYKLKEKKYTELDLSTKS
jgi:hypothetical protein